MDSNSTRLLSMSVSVQPGKLMKYILAALVSLCLGSALAAQDSGQDFIPEGFTEDEWNKFTSAQQESLLASASTYEEALARIRQFQEIYLRSALDNDRMAPELADTRRDCMLGSTQSVFEERALTGSFPPPVADLCLGALELSVEAELKPEIYNEGFIDYDRAAQINLLSRYRDMLDQTHIPATEQNARIFRRALFDTMADDVAALRESLTDPEVAANPGRVSAVETATDAFLLAEDPVLHDNKQYDVPLNPAYFENGPNGKDVVAGKPTYYPMLPSIAVDVNSP